MTTLFISDLHLEKDRPDLSDAFVRFCETEATHAKALYILGDLVDAWLGDDDDSEIPQLVTQTLASLSGQGVEVYLMPGNRDFLYGDDFAKASGCTLLSDPTVIELSGKTTLLMHGDSLCTDDQEYMAFRAQIRNPEMQALLLAKPLAERRAIAKQLRDQSKSANARKAEDIMDVNQQAVLDAMHEHQAQQLIHGHTHRPHVHELELNGTVATRTVLGDWDQLGWVLRVSDTQQSLEQFPIDNP